MLTHTFIHIPSIGFKTERSLWNKGISCWDDVLAAGASHMPKKDLLLCHLARSHAMLKERNAHYFSQTLSPAEQWRLFSEFEKNTAYLDIETTGLGSGIDHITTLSLYGGNTVQYYVHGKNLDDFIADVSAYKVLVTYNGRCFDLPFIERQFKIKLPHAHIDLRYVLRSLGYKGGLKGCEKQLGIERNELEGVDGYTAVLLWQEYKRTANERALETLLAYNIADTVNLEKLMRIAYNKKVKQTPFAHLVVEENIPGPDIPFRADTDLLRSLIYPQTERTHYL